MKLKICGIRNKEMLDFCEKNQVDFCGFNFVPTSKRKINTDFHVPKNFKPKKVGIFMDQSFDEVSEILNKFYLDIAQFHGNEDAIVLQKLKEHFPELIMWKAFSVKEGFDVNKLQWYCINVDMLLFDGASPGSGQEIEVENKEMLQAAIKSCEELDIPYGIAGGINFENIAEFKKKFSKASFLDTASGVEKDGKFDISTAQKLITNFKK